jgi:hypothetical protein
VSGQESHGVECAGCHQTHDDYEKLGESSFANGWYAGIRERIKCGRCGHINTQERT